MNEEKTENAASKNMTMRISLIGLFAALSYSVFRFGKIDIPLPGGDATSFHLGNSICVLGALLMGEFYGGLGGSIGMTIGDLFEPKYVVHAPRTFILKLGIGFVTGIVAHKIGKIGTLNSEKDRYKWTIISASSGMLFNVIFAPIASYYYRLLILGRPAAELTISFNILTTTVNAVASVIVTVIVYPPLRRAIKKAGLLQGIIK